MAAVGGSRVQPLAAQVGVASGEERSRVFPYLSVLPSGCSRHHLDPGAPLKPLRLLRNNLQRPLQVTSGQTSVEGYIKEQDRDR